MSTTGSIGTIFIVIVDIHHFCVHLVDTRCCCFHCDNKIALALLRVDRQRVPRREIKMNTTSKNEDDVKTSFTVSVRQHFEKSSTHNNKCKNSEQQQKSRCKVQIVPSYSRI